MPNRPSKNNPLKETSFQILFDEIDITDGTVATIIEVAKASEAISELQEASAAMYERTYQSGFAGPSGIPTQHTVHPQANYSLTSVYKSS